MPRERRAAIYLRVSSDEQTYENQRPDVRRLARTRGYKIIATGMERARRDGVHIGRPAARVDVRRARSLRADGLPLREIAARLRVSLATLKRAMAGLKRGSSPKTP
jgi:DNA invertase Pin-like site-specific DNA recombinase